MDNVPQRPGDCKNLLLSMLPEEDYLSLLPHLEWKPTPLHFVLFERDKPISHAYFPLSGAHSILTIMTNGSMVEVGTVGFEGMSTVDLLTGSKIATETTVCQIPGESLRMEVDIFRQILADSPALRHITSRYLQAYLTQVSQSVACNALHPIEQRFARWILMSHDRVHRQSFQLTQEYLASMLGVHRPSVSVAAGRLQQEGVIDYKRGIITILDRDRLEQAACECYKVVADHHRRLLGKRIDMH